MLDKILKIQYFAIRQLPSPKPLPTVVLAKNERYRDRFSVLAPYPSIPTQKPGIETLTPEENTRSWHTHI